MDENVRWIAVTGVPREETLSRYLYGVSTLVTCDEGRRRALVLVATIFAAPDAAQNQADRIRSSGQMSAVVFDTYAEAHLHFLDV